ncbi:MAG: thermonuclease family protein [Nitrospinota bacterium]
MKMSLMMTILFLTPVIARSEIVKSIKPGSLMIGKVVKVGGGDTVLFKLADGNLHKIQLAYIDAPDKNKSNAKSQPFHLDSIKKLEELVADEDLLVESLGIDKFQRVIGVVFKGKININIEMVLNGYAEIYYPVRSNPEKYNQYYLTKLLYAEKLAEEDRLGIWGIPTYLSPYAFRRKGR